MNGLFDLTGQVALVTGGGRGIGRAIAEGLAQHGARVIVCGRNREALDFTCSAIGAAASAEVADVASEAELAALGERVAHQFGRLDILVNNAGISPHYGAIEKLRTEDWQAVLDTNLSGPYYCCKHLGGLMVPQKSGSIVNITSVAGKVGLKRQVAYCASKGGLELLTRAWALDWAEHGIRVNAIGYGYVRTDMTSDLLDHPHISARLLARTPLGRFGEVSEVAGAAVFLASRAASYVTGHTVMVDGGWTAG